MRKTFALLILAAVGLSPIAYAGGKQCAVKTSAKAKDKATCTAGQAACCASKTVKRVSVSPLTKGATLLAQR